MVIKQLYESLINSLNEARIQRTIDKKLWLTVASICSRNKSTQSELIKPLSKMSKEEILQRYVAALLIMKKSCPETKQDIESLKTFKLFGQKYLSLGGTIEDIKKLYLENGGSGVSVQTPVNNIKQERTKLEQEINKPTEQQIKTPVTKEPIEQSDDDIDELPDGINTYDDILKYVNKKYNDINELYKQIYEILETTYFTIQRTFHKIPLKNDIIYFNTVQTDDNKKIYVRNTKEVQISWIKFNTKQLRSKEEGVISVIINNMTINNKMISDNIKLSDSISISLDDFMEMSKIILSKLLYVKQIKYNNPFLNINKDKKVSKSLGSFDNKPININTSINQSILTTLIDKLSKQYNTMKKLHEAFVQLLGKYRMGNTGNGSSFLMPNPYCSMNAGPNGPNDKSMKLYVKGVKYNTALSNDHIYLICEIIKGYNTISYQLHVNLYSFKEKSEQWERAEWTWSKNQIVPYISGAKLYKLLIYSMAYFLYYTNNYDNLI